jgi:hypothetical protein
VLTPGIATETEDASAPGATPEIGVTRARSTRAPTLPRPRRDPFTPTSTGARAPQCPDAAALFHRPPLTEASPARPSTSRNRHALYPEEPLLVISFSAQRPRHRVSKILLDGSALVVPVGRLRAARSRGPPRRDRGATVAFSRTLQTLEPASRRDRTGTDLVERERALPVVPVRPGPIALQAAPATCRSTIRSPTP